MARPMRSTVRRAARFEVVTSRMQLDEIRRASRYPKLQAILQPAKVGAMINNLQRAVVLERLTIEVEADDPDDSFCWPWPWRAMRTTR